MDHTNFVESSLDIDLFFMSLSEKGAHGHMQGATDTGAGDRAVASQSRIGGADQLEHVLAVLPDALRSAGWTDGSPINAVVDDGSHDENVGRKWSLRNAIATATITLDSTDDEVHTGNVQSILSASEVPDDSISVTKTGSQIIITMRYLSDGNGADAIAELADSLQKAGVTVGS
jgi:hypothetical protein